MGIGIESESTNYVGSKKTPDQLQNSKEKNRERVKKVQRQHDTRTKGNALFM